MNILAKDLQRPLSTIAPEDPTVAILREIARERIAMQRGRGGENLEGAYSARTWQELVRMHADLLVVTSSGGFMPAWNYRERMLSIAATALAAVECHDANERRGEAGR
jgi:hypothetical protein